MSKEAPLLSLGATLSSTPSAPPTGASRAQQIELSQASLFFDLDGTLAEISPRPEQVGPDARRSELLRRMGAALGGRLAVVSGRTIAEIDRVLEGAVPCVAGVHGLARRLANGNVVQAQPHPQIETAAVAFRALAAARAGLQVEEKSLSVTLHYRNAPGAEDAVRDLAQRLAQTTGLELQEGRMVVELKTPGADKGDAVAAFMLEPPFAGSTPIFVGDDLTDEAGFQAALAAGGLAVLVGPARATAAGHALTDPAAVLDWMEQALAAGALRLEALS